MPPVYRVTDVQDSTYLGPGGKVVSGFAVTFEISSIGETHTINVERNEPKLVDERIRAEVAKLEQLRKLGAG